LIIAGSSTTEPRAMLISGPERFDHVGRDQVPCLRSTDGRDHQEVALPRQFNNVGNVLIGSIGLAPRPGVNHPHLERYGAIGDGAADGAEPDHAERLAADAVAERDRPFFFPGTAANIVVRVDNLPARGEHHADAQIGAFVAHDAGRIGHRDAALACRGNIDEVDSSAEAGNDFELRQCRNQCPVDAAVDLDGSQAHPRPQVGVDLLRLRLHRPVVHRETAMELLDRRLRKRAEVQNFRVHAG